MLCKKCHTEMTVMQEDNVSGLICPKCGWNIITTKIDDIMLDTQPVSYTHLTLPTILLV